MSEPLNKHEHRTIKCFSTRIVLIVLLIIKPNDSPKVYVKWFLSLNHKASSILSNFLLYAAASCHLHLEASTQCTAVLSICCQIWISYFWSCLLFAAYINNGSFNVFFVDWGKLAEPPCYPASVHNMRPVARCLADVFTFLRASGLPIERTTCVGHSLGAHICGIMANFLLFRVHRIIGIFYFRPDVNFLLTHDSFSSTQILVGEKSGFGIVNFINYKYMQMLF